MRTHRFEVGFPGLMTRRQRADGSPTPSFEVEIADVPAAETRAALRVHYGPVDDGDDAILVSWRDGLYAEYGGIDYWSHGPRRSRGASPAEVGTLLRQPTTPTGGWNALHASLSPDSHPRRRRVGPDAADQREADVRRRAARLLFIDGRLHRRVEEPVWSVRHHPGGAGDDVVRAEIAVHVLPSRYPSSDVRFDRGEVAAELARLRAGRHRNCRVAAPFGSVERLDPCYEPTYDAEAAMTRAYGEDVVCKVEAVLPLLDRGCVEAFAAMADGFAAVGSGDAAAAETFCDGLVDLHARLAADRRQVPDALANWLRERVPGIVARVGVARAMERTAASAPRP